MHVWIVCQHETYSPRFDIEAGFSSREGAVAYIISRLRGTEAYRNKDVRQLKIYMDDFNVEVVSIDTYKMDSSSESFKVEELKNIPDFDWVFS